MATFISSRCTRQRRNLPIVPEIAPDDGSTTDEDWQFILQNSTKSQPVRTRQSAQSAPGGPNFTVFQASTSIIEDDLQEANHTLLMQRFGVSQSLVRWIANCLCLLIYNLWLRKCLYFFQGDVGFNTTIHCFHSVKINLFLLISKIMYLWNCYLILHYRNLYLYLSFQFIKIEKSRNVFSIQVGIVILHKLQNNFLKKSFNHPQYISFLGTRSTNSFWTNLSS